MSTVTEIVSVSVLNKKISAFVGKGGFHIKKYLVIPTKKEYLEVDDVKTSDVPDEKWTSCKVYCSVSLVDEEISIKCVVPDDKCMQILKTNINKYVEIYNDKFKQKSKNKNKKDGVGKRTYTFNLKIHPRYIGKLVGVEGSNINEFKNDLKKSLDINKYPFVKLSDTHNSDSSPTLSFDDLDSGDLFITVSFFGCKSFVNVKNMVQSYVHNLFQEQDEHDDELEEHDDELEEHYDELEEQQNNGW